MSYGHHKNDEGLDPLYNRLNLAFLWFEYLYNLGRDEVGPRLGEVVVEELDRSTYSRSTRLTYYVPPPLDLIQERLGMAGRPLPMSTLYPCGIVVRSP